MSHFNQEPRDTFASIITDARRETAACFAAHMRMEA